MPAYSKLVQHRSLHSVHVLLAGCLALPHDQKQCIIILPGLQSPSPTHLCDIFNSNTEYLSTDQYMAAAPGLNLPT